MIKHYIFCLLLSILHLSSFSQNSPTKDITESPYFSVLTCSPGNEVYSTFGHTAIRYVDNSLNIDVVFNYGIFSYSEDFILNFVKGHTYYQLGVQDFSGFISEYVFYNRGVIEQILQLSDIEKKEMLAYLTKNYEPQNRKYLYKFFFDNCSSRPRDIIEKIVGKNLTWNGISPTNTKSLYDSLWLNDMYTLAYNKTVPHTYRTFLHAYVPKNSWLDCGINVALGYPTDSSLSAYNSMFLPEFACIQLQHASIINNGIKAPLVAKSRVLLTPEYENVSTPFSEKPILVFLCIALLIIGITALEHYKKIHLYWFDSLLLFVFGLVGVVVWFISFISIHTSVFPNIHTIWLSALHIPFAIMWIIPKLRNYVKWYLPIYAIIFAVLSVLSALEIGQYIPTAFLSLFIALAIRFGYYSWLYKKS